MSTPWTSATGLAFPDLVPARLRRQWVAEGWCPDRDLYTLFLDEVRAHPDRTAVVDPTGSLDYTSLDRVVRQIAAGLAASGHGPRDVIGIQLPNGWRAVAAELAVYAIGAVSLPFPTDRSRGEALGLLRRARASAVILAGSVAGRIVTSGPGELCSRLPHLGSMFVFGGAEDTRGPSVDAWLDNESGDGDWRPRSVDPGAPARILVTSGSEAEPKMIAYSHNAVAGGRANYVRALHEGGGPMRNLVLVPLSSGFGSLGIPVTVARLGGTLLLLEQFEASAALRMITTQDPTHVFGVPTMLRRMADQAPTTAEDTSSLRAVVASGAPLNATTIEACRRRFDCPILNIYGSSDGVNCHTTPADSPPQPGQAGRPDPSVASIRVVDEAGDPVPPGELGEIRARGPMTPLCYVGAPRLNERYRTEGGWVRSGDLGRMARDGQLWVVGRMGQVVIRGGENISPAEIERELTAHPRIREALCVGVPDPELGQRLCACVVQAPQADAVALAELRAFLADERGVRRRLLPEFLVVVPALPLGPTGKVSREAIRSLAIDRLDDRREGDGGPAPSRSDTTPPETRDR